MGIYSDKFRRLARKHIEDQKIAENFIQWTTCITLELTEPSFKEEWGEGGARGNVYTIYREFYEQYVKTTLDEVAFMLHEYYHHICDRILWNRITTSKQKFTIKERNFMEDMYVNSWLRIENPEVSSAWEKFLINHDIFHGLKFSEEENKYNSLLTSDILSCHNGLTFLYQKINNKTHEFLDPRMFAFYASYWNSTLRDDEDVKDMLNTMQINKEEWNYETCKAGSPEKAQQEEENNTG